MSELFVLEDARRSASPAAGRGPAGVHQVIRMPDERLRRRANGGHRGRGRATARLMRSRTPISSFSTPAISANGRRRKSIPSSASCASSRTSARRRGRRTTLVVAGCVAQAEGAEILRRQPAVDVVVGPQSYHRLPQLVREARVRPGVVDTDFPAEDKFAHLPISHARRDSPSRRRARSSPCRRAATSSARSASCPIRAAPRPRVPFARSSTRSRASPARGVREVTLIGQNVNAYHGLERGWPRRRACRADPRRRRRARDRPRALCDLAPGRHERRPDRRPSRRRSARAVSASAGPIRLGPGADSR